MYKMLNSATTRLHSLLPKWISSYLIKDINRSGFNKYFKNTWWLFFSRFFLMATNFFVGAYLARYLQPSDFGTYNYIISFVGLFSFISGFGTDSILGRELILHPEKKQKILGSAIYIGLLSAGVAILVANISAFIIEVDIYTQLLIFIFSLTFLFQAAGVFNIYFLSTVQAKKATYIQISVSIINNTLKIIGFLTEQELLWFICLFVVDAIVNTLWSIKVFKQSNECVDLNLNIQLIKHLIYQAFPFTLSIVAVSIYMKIDQVMITHMLGVEQNGIYSVAVKLTETWYFIPSLICTSLFPAIVNAKKINPKTYYSRINSLLLLMLIISILFTIPIFIITPFIITYLYGLSYIEAITPFQVYIWSSIPIFIMPALTAFITAENLGKNLLISTISGAIINVLLNIALIPSHGIIGSAVATFVSYTIPTFYLYILFKKHKKKTYDHS